MSQCFFLKAQVRLMSCNPFGRDKGISPVITQTKYHKYRMTPHVKGEQPCILGFDVDRVLSALTGQKPETTNQACKCPWLHICAFAANFSFVC